MVYKFIIIVLIIVVGILLINIYEREQKIKKISSQINEILYQQKDLYIQQYEEGSLSILESEIVKLVHLLNEQNHILKDDKLLLKQSLEDISHQIKTPLTALNLIQERLKNTEETKKRKLIKEQQILLNKIEWLVYSLLKIARLDAGTVIFLKEDILQKDFLEQLIKPFEIQIELKNIKIEKAFQNNYLYNIDIQWTLEAISNILKNSIEHIQKNGKISLLIQQNPLYDEIIIKDDGEGINQEDLPHLFKRFYKGKNATNESVGIGLSLSQKIIEKQNGTIAVENTYPGVKFTIHFYKEVI